MEGSSSSLERSLFERSSPEVHEQGVPPGEGHPHLPRERDYVIEAKMTTMSDPSLGLLHFRGYREVPRPQMELQGLC